VATRASKVADEAGNYAPSQDMPLTDAAPPFNMSDYSYYLDAD
jgi:hypothetical protein